MSIELSFVPLNMVYRVVGGLAKFLDMAAEHSVGRTSSTDILRMILTGQYQLWVVYDKDTNEMHGFFVTEVRNYPQVRMLVVQNVAIEDHLMVLIESKMQDMATAYARDQGCAGIEFHGRNGWKDYAKRHGFVARGTIFEKMLSEAPK